jgi:hypothetical protein
MLMKQKNSQLPIMRTQFLKILLNPFERTDSLLCRVELLGGENVSLIARLRSSSSRVGRCRVENMTKNVKISLLQSQLIFTDQ